MTTQLATVALFLLSTFYGNLPVQTGAPMAVEAAKRVKTEDSVRPTAPVVDQPVTLEEYVREYYKDTPVLAEIAKCESRFRHLGLDGKVIRGELSEEDIGVMQINEFYHEERAERLGLDLHTLDGNLAYAKWLYNKESAIPWFASSKCWQRSDTLANASTNKPATN